MPVINSFGTAAARAWGTATNVVNVPIDPYFDNVVFLAHFDGTNGSNTIVDSSYLGNTPTINGAGTISTVDKKFGVSSWKASTGNSYFTVSLGYDGYMTGDFTWECWYTGNGGTNVIMCSATAAGTAYNPAGGYIYNGYYQGYGGTALPLTTSNVAWTHIAISRTGSSLSSFTNGVLGSTVTYAGAIDLQLCKYGYYITGGNLFYQGYYDEIRITKGIGRYTSTFSVPTAAFPDRGPTTYDSYYSSVSLLLHGEGSNGSTTFTDNSPTPKTITRQPAGYSLGPITTVTGTQASRDIIYANNQFVSIAGTGSMTSPNGITWTGGTLPAGPTAYWGLAYGNGVYVTMGNSSAIAATSTDGLNWTSRALPVSTGWYSVVFGNNTFVASNSGNTYVLTSSDGITWTQRTTPAGSSCLPAFGAGLFVYPNYNPRNVYTSPDGITWTTRTNALPAWPVATTVSIIKYGGGKFVLGTTTSTGTVGYTAYSSDGITWTQSTFPHTAVAYWYGLAHSGNMWYASVYGASVGAISYDGIYWQAVSGGGNNGANHVAYGNGVFVVGNLSLGQVAVIPEVSSQTAISTTTKKIGTSSMSFANNSLTVTPESSFDLGSGNFTIEMYAKFNTLPATGNYMALLTKGWNDTAQNDYSYFFGIGAGVGTGVTTHLAFYHSSNGLAATVTSANVTWTGVAINTWVHLAAVRNGNAITCYVNGIGGTPETFAGTIFNSTSNLYIGVDPTVTLNIQPNAYLDEIRITNAARYTANFNPPTAPGPNS